MKIRITHPAYGYQAGLIYDVPELQAQELLKADYAISVIDDIDSKPEPANNKKKVTHGNG